MAFKFAPEKSSSGIMQYFPADREPRPGQPELLQSIEANWSKYDVFVVVAPTAFGKTIIAETLQQWMCKTYKQSSLYLHPTNVLLEQFKKDHPRWHCMFRKDYYKCIHSKFNESCADHHNETDEHCAECPYIKAMKKCHVIPYMACNYWSYMALRIRKDVLIFDEAHNTLPLAAEMGCKKLWHREYEFPTNIFTYRKLKEWVDNHPKLQRDKKLKGLKEMLDAGMLKWIVSYTEEEYRKQWDRCLKLTPLDIREYAQKLWPVRKDSTKQKLILMSATMNSVDIKELGLDDRRVLYLKPGSPIPVERRPLHYVPVGSMGVKEAEANLQKVVEFIRQLMTERPEKGIIHCTYQIQERLRELMGDDPRLLFHDRETRTSIYNHFMSEQSRPDAVLVASGLYEGVDIAYDAGRWQVLVKVPYPSLTNPAIKHKCEQDPEWYMWETLKQVIQMYGRICRAPDDYGDTFIIDSNYGRLYKQGRHLCPQWFQDANRFDKE